MANKTFQDALMQDLSCKLDKTKCDHKLYGFRDNCPEEIYSNDEIDDMFNGDKFVINGLNPNGVNIIVPGVETTNLPFTVQAGKIIFAGPSNDFNHHKFELDSNFIRMIYNDGTKTSGITADADGIKFTGIPVTSTFNYVYVEESGILKKVLADTISSYTDVWQPITLTSTQFTFDKYNYISYFFNLTANTVTAELAASKTLSTANRCTILYKNIASTNILLEVPSDDTTYICLSPNPVTLLPNQHVEVIYKGDALKRHIKITVQDFVLNRIFTVNNDSYSVNANAQTVTPTVTSHNEGSISLLNFEITSFPNWVTVTKGTPSGITCPLTIQFTESTLASARTGTIVLTQDGGNVINISLTQAARSTIFTITPTSKNVVGAGETFAATVSSDINGTFTDFTITSSPAWLTVTKGTTTGTSTPLNIVVSELTSTTPRNGNIVVTQNTTGAIATLAITQAAATTTFTANPTSLSYEASTGLTKTTAITSSIGSTFQDYTVTSSPSWLTVTKGAIVGTVSTLNAIAASNSSSLRSGNIVLTQGTTGATLTIPVSQAASAIQFSASKTLLEYTAGIVCSDESDINTITSSINGVFASYVVTSKPVWTTVTIGATSGLTSTLNIIITPNITESNKSGNIVLTQSTSGNVITIPVTQTSQFGADGLPISYPTVGTETILGTNYNTAYIGEQSWLRENVDWFSLDQSWGITQTIIDTWKANNGAYWTAPLTVQEYNDTFHKSFNRTGKEAFQAQLQISYGDATIDIHKHQVPTYDDYKQMLGFIVAKHGDVIGTQGQTIYKYPLDIATNTWDCARDSYPSTWNNQNSNGKNGKDTYLLGFNLGGAYQPYDQTYNNIPLMRQAFYHVRDAVTSGDSNWNNEVFYTTGWQFPRDLTKGNMNAFLAKPIKTVRYVPLTWDIYDNGTTIIKVNNGDTVPGGYTKVPIGSLRGAWFGNPTATRATLQANVNQINQFIANDWDQMG